TNLLDLLDHYDARAYRMLLLQTHYRSPVKVGQDNIDASVKALAGLDAFAARSATLTGKADAETLARFVELMNNNLDTPHAMAHIFDTVRRANSAIDSGDAAAAGLVAAVHEMCGAVGLTLGAIVAVDDDAQTKAAALDAARAAKDFAKADALRNELQSAGWIVETTKAGTTLRRA
ncbi:MAG: DALR domain-containing protein, partial [Actinomycetota bacterium]